MKGQTLIEVLVAMTIGAVVIAAVADVVLSSLSAEQSNVNQTKADQFAQEGMEISLQNASVDEGAYCLDQHAVVLPPSPPVGVIDGYGQCSNVNINPDSLTNTTNKTMKRTVTLKKTSSSCPIPVGQTQHLTQIIVVVSWNDKKCGLTPYCHQSREESCI